MMVMVCVHTHIATALQTNSGRIAITWPDSAGVVLRLLMMYAK